MGGHTEDPREYPGSLLDIARSLEALAAEMERGAATGQEPVVMPSGGGGRAVGLLPSQWVFVLAQGVRELAGCPREPGDAGGDPESVGPRLVR